MPIKKTNNQIEYMTSVVYSYSLIKPRRFIMIYLIQDLYQLEAELLDAIKCEDWNQADAIEQEIKEMKDYFKEIES